MEVNRARIQELIDRPSESLAVEIKTWLDPETREGQAKIVRSILALRNHGGGYFLIGFDDETLQPDHSGIPANVRASFHIDKIQALIGRYASEPFEVAIEFVERDGIMFPVMVVPTGVRTPVAAKADLISNDKKLVATDEVYVRTLRSNNTPSTAKASWKDWEPLVNVCFDNREADIGRFLRRHLGTLAPGLLQHLTISPPPSPLLPPPPPSAISVVQSLVNLLDAGEQRFHQLVAERTLTLPSVGWWEVALIIDGDVPAHSPNKAFLELLDANNPNLTGWPVWMDTRSFSDPLERPYVVDGSWESLVVSLDGFPSNIDFQKLNPKGTFYLRWALQDDLANSPRAPAPRTSFDFGLPIIRSAEAIAVGIAYAKAMGCNPEQCSLEFAFRWSGLKDRELNSWAQPRRIISPGRRSYQDKVVVFQRVALDTPLSAIGGLLATALKPLYEIFDGFELGSSVIEDLSTRLIERRL